MSTIPLRILIVEDNPADARLLEILLRARFSDGVTARADSFAAALEAVRTSSFDVVLLDPGLPDSPLNGMMARFKEAAPKAAIIVLSGVSDERIGMEAVREGAQDYLVKGRIDAEVLARALRYAVERQRSLEMIRQQHEQNSLAGAGAHLVLWEWDRSADSLSVIGRWGDAFGLPELDGIRTASEFWRRVHKDDLPRIQAGVESSAASGRDYRFEFRFLGMDGRQVWCEAYARPVKDAKPPGRWLGVTVNIDRRKRAEMALRTISSRTATATGPDFFGLLSRNLSEALGTEWAGVVELHPAKPGWARVMASWYRGCEGGEMEYALAGTPCELTMEHGVCYYPDGVADAFPQDEILRQMGAAGYAGAFMTDSGGRRLGLLAVLHNAPLRMESDEVLPLLQLFALRAGAEIERLKAEASLRERDAQLQQAQRLEAVGRLAGGVAHDFNNLLTAIRGYVSLASSTLPAGHPALQSLTRVEEAAQQATSVAGSLQTFARRGPAINRLIPLRSTLEAAARLFRRMIPATVRLGIDLAEKECWVLADETRLQHAVLNLLLRSRDRVGTQGEIDLTMGLTLAAAAGGEARVSVSDNGPPLTDDERQHLCEPFYGPASGDGAAHSNGLQLSVTHGIVAELGGRVEAASGRDGPMLTLVLPLSEPPEATETDESAPRGGRALVIEPNQLVRGLLASMLEALQFTVVGAAGAPDVAAETETAGSTFDLVVGSASLSAPTWREILGHVRRASPAARALAVASRDVSTDGLSELGVMVLHKPFRLIDMRTAVRELQDREHTGVMP